MKETLIKYYPYMRRGESFSSKEDLSFQKQLSFSQLEPFQVVTDDFLKEIKQDIDLTKTYGYDPYYFYSYTYLFHLIKDFSFGKNLDPYDLIEGLLDKRYALYSVPTSEEVFLTSTSFNQLKDYAKTSPHLIFESPHRFALLLSLTNE